MSVFGTVTHCVEHAAQSGEYPLRLWGYISGKAPQGLPRTVTNRALGVTVTTQLQKVEATLPFT